MSQGQEKKQSNSADSGTKRVVLIWLAITAVIIVAAVIWYWDWDWLNDGESNSATLRNLGLLVFGVVGFSLAAWRTGIAAKNVEIANRNTELAAKNVEIAAANTEIANRNSVTDTFTKAIEQLGSSSQDKPNIEVRLGAIYALEKLSQSTDYYQAIIDILCSYVRQNSPSTEENTTVRIDVQTAMTVIGRRSAKQDETPLNLNHTNLNGVFLVRAKLVGANLARANLAKANLFRANLFRADLRRANLAEASLWGARLGQAKLEEAYLAEAFLGGTEHLTCEQLQKATDWEKSYRDPALSCGAEIPRRRNKS